MRPSLGDEGLDLTGTRFCRALLAELRIFIIHKVGRHSRVLRCVCGGVEDVCGWVG